MDLVEQRVEAGRRHPWELSRAGFYLEVLLGLRPEGRPSSWLDIGAGDAWLAEQLRAVTPPEDRVVCWDINYSPDDLRRSNVGLEFTASRPDRTFDILLMLDVIEHVEDDAEFLSSIVEACLAPDGLVLLSVPAYMRLFSAHDQFLRHFRRYSPRTARSLIAASGLEVVTEGGLFFSLLPIRALQVTIEKRRRTTPETYGVGTWTGGTLATSLTRSILSADGRMSRALARHHLFLPGLSYWAVCRRATKMDRP